MGTPSGETKPKKRQNCCQASFLCFFPLCQKPRVGRSPRGTLDTTEVAVSGSQESLEKGRFEEVFLPKRECSFPGRAAVPSGKQLTSSASGPDGCKRTGVPRQTPRRAPRLCRVGCGRDSQETAAQSSVFLPAG